MYQVCTSMYHVCTSGAWQEVLSELPHITISQTLCRMLWAFSKFHFPFSPVLSGRCCCSISRRSTAFCCSSGSSDSKMWDWLVTIFHSLHWLLSIWHLHVCIMLHSSKPCKAGFRSSTYKVHTKYMLVQTQYILSTYKYVLSMNSAHTQYWVMPAAFSSQSCDSVLFGVHTLCILCMAECCIGMYSGIVRNQPDL